jgi:hypothetical protein
MSTKLQGGKLLLMGSSAFKAKELPVEVKKRIDYAIKHNITIVVGEAHGACRLFQDYLAQKGYGNVIVGHAKSIRYNAGNWRDKQYGQNLREREKNMIEECDATIIIWQDKSSVIAENLERLKKAKKPTFLYEYDSHSNTARSGRLDPNRIYSHWYYVTH